MLLFWPHVPSPLSCLITPSHLCTRVHTHAQTHTHIHYLPDNSASFALCHLLPPSSSSFLHTPVFPSSPSLLSPFSVPLTTAAAVIHVMKRGEIFESLSPHISLFPLLLSFHLILLPLLYVAGVFFVCFFFLSKFLLQHAVLFSKKSKSENIKILNSLFSLQL